MLNSLIKNIPVVGQAYGFTKVAIRAYNATSPVEAVKVGVVSIIDSCTLPQVKYPINKAHEGHLIP